MIEHHRARRLALQVLCCLDVQGEKAMADVGEFIDDSHEKPETLNLARTMMTEAFAAREKADGLINHESYRWNVSRMALVDRNILRLAAWEILSGRTPRKVAISEAVRLAKEFSSSEAPRFVNAVLDAVARRLHEGRKGPALGATPPDGPPAVEGEGPPAAP